MTGPRVLYISPLDMVASNGMAQLQHQLLSCLCSLYPDSVDLLSLSAPPATAREWLRRAGLPVTVLDGFYPRLAWLNNMLWYGGGVILCNKLRWIDRFYFPLRTALPRAWIDRYDLIVSYYAWAHGLLRLDRAGRKVVMDLGDVMADRHERIGTRRWVSLAADDERRILQSDARCVAVSDEDAAEFERLYGVRPSVLSFVPPDSAQLIQLASQEGPPRAGFLGAPGFGNEEIMRLLAQPAFLRGLSGAGVQFLVAGGICGTVEPSVLRALEQGGARVLGRVPSTLDYYRQISAVVNPIGPSTGVKIKSVEALVAGRTLITTRWGADPALHAAFPGQIACIDWPIDPGSLAQLVVAAVRNPSQAPDSSAAKAYVDGATRNLCELHAL